jgi:hypothetical protein
MLNKYLIFITFVKMLQHFQKNIFDNDENKYRPWSEQICQLLKDSKANGAISIIESLV